MVSVRERVNVITICESGINEMCNKINYNLQKKIVL